MKHKCPQILNRSLSSEKPSIFFSIPEFKDDPVWLGIPQDGRPRLELCSNLSGVSGRGVQGVDGEEVGQHQEELHVLAGLLKQTPDDILQVWRTPTSNFCLISP